MKKISFFALAFSILGVNAFAQSDMDAYKLSKNDLKGTARSVAMGGAFGALGGDASGVAINPAGIGVYSMSELTGTLNFSNAQTETSLNAGTLKDSKFKVGIDNFSYVGVFPISSDAVPSINVGFAYNKLKSFDRKYKMQGDNLNHSLTDYMADRAKGFTDNQLSMQNGAPFSNADWMATLGYNSYLINPKTPGGTAWGRTLPQGESVYNDLVVSEKGSVNSYDFNIGFTAVDILSVGASISVTDINYHQYSLYDESFNAKEGFELQNWLKTEGTGYQVKIGAILKPIDELRIGVAYHSPTWYDMTDSYEAYIYQDIPSFVTDPNYKKGGISTYDEAGNTAFDYQMRTPDKWVFSLASVIANTAIVSVDYELTNYGNMSLKDRDGYALATNPFIKQDYKAASTVRAGLEVRITPQFSGRIGYAWMESPVKTEFKDNPEKAQPVGTIPNFVLDGHVNHFTYGLGYRFTRNFYTDVAFVLKSQKDELYTAPNMPKAELKTNTFQGMLTLGYRF